MRALPAILLGLLALLSWGLVAWWLDSPTMPGPWRVAQAAGVLAMDGKLLADIAASLGRVSVGFCTAAVLGVLLGAASAALGRWGRALRRLLELLRPIPPIAWVPLAILWFGLGDPSAWFIVFLGAFFPIYIQVTLALADCPPAWLELAHSLGARPGLVLWRVRLPAAMPQVVAGLRTGLGLAWTSLIAAELVGAQSGLGYRIQMHRLVLETEGVVVGMLCIGLLGAAMALGASWLERRLVPWSGAS